MSLFFRGYRSKMLADNLHLTAWWKGFFGDLKTWLYDKGHRSQSQPMKGRPEYGQRPVQNLFRHLYTH